MPAMSGGGNLTDAVPALSKADLALQTTVAVRDRVVPGLSGHHARCRCRASGPRSHRPGPASGRAVATGSALWRGDVAGLLARRWWR